MEEQKIYNSFAKDHIKIKWGFIVILGISIISVFGTAIYASKEIKEAQNSVVVVDSDNTSFIGQRELISRDRRMGQLIKHVEMFMSLFWNVSQERENIEKSVNRALLLSDESGIRLYERYYQKQGLDNWLLENSGHSIITIEEIEIDMSTYPYSGFIIAINELESPTGSSKRHMNLTFQISDYPASYDNVAGAMLFNIEVENDKIVSNE